MPEDAEGGGGCHGKLHLNPWEDNGKWEKTNIRHSLGQGKEESGALQPAWPPLCPWKADRANPLAVTAQHLKEQKGTSRRDLPRAPGPEQLTPLAGRTSGCVEEAWLRGEQWK